MGWYDGYIKGQGAPEMIATLTLRNGKKKTVYDKDKNTIILRPATIMASSVNEVSGKIIMLNAETE